MVPIWITLSDLWPGFQGHAIFEVEYRKKWHVLKHTNRKLYLTYGMLLVPQSIAGPGLVSFLEAQAAKWVHMPFSSKARHYARTLKDWVGECRTHSSVRVLFDRFSNYDRRRAEADQPRCSWQRHPVKSGMHFLLLYLVCNSVVSADKPMCAITTDSSLWCL